MEAMETSDASLKGQAEMWQHMLSFADSMALKCAVELGIADIINSSHGGPVTLSQIASCLNSPSPDISYLSRIMGLLVRKKIFATYNDESNDGETLYGLTHSSRWILRDLEVSLAPMILMENHPWDSFSRCELWDFTLKNPQINSIFNDAMACTSKIVSQTVVSGYKDGFSCIGSLVEVGGRIGGMLAQIVKSYPHIKGINFYLSHVIATAPKYDGISHVEGDMFQSILLQIKRGNKDKN